MESLDQWILGLVASVGILLAMLFRNRPAKASQPQPAAGLRSARTEITEKAIAAHGEVTDALESDDPEGEIAELLSQLRENGDGT